MPDPRTTGSGLMAGPPDPGSVFQPLWPTLADRRGPVRIEVQRSRQLLPRTPGSRSNDALRHLTHMPNSGRCVLAYLCAGLDAVGGCSDVNSDLSCTGARRTRFRAGRWPAVGGLRTRTDRLIRRAARSLQGGPPGRSRGRLKRADGPGTGYGTRSLSRYGSYLFGPGVPERQ